MKNEVLCLANIGVLAKDRFWLLWMTPSGRVPVSVDGGFGAAQFAEVSLAM
jgi:hypothetical protein